MTVVRFPCPVPEALLEELEAAYAEPPRAYHSFAHVKEVLEEHARTPGFVDPITTALALLFHDAVYVAGRTDNEERSVTLARVLAHKYLPEHAARFHRVEALIRLTARHGHLSPSDVDPDARLFLDCDMAILGAAAPRFDEYDRAVREEYGHLDGGAYSAGRSAFLHRLLGAPRIFLSGYFHELLDARARENLRRALAHLPDSSRASVPG